MAHTHVHELSNLRCLARCLQYSVSLLRDAVEEGSGAVGDDSRLASEETTRLSQQCKEARDALMIFGLHLGLLGYLCYRAWYVPKVIGILLALDGLGWVIQPLRPYLYLNSHVGSIFVQFFPFFAFTELFLPRWLVIRGWKIQEPAQPVFEARGLIN